MAYRIIGCCVAVHKELGPGFVESIYHRAVELELTAQRTPFESEVEVQLTCRGMDIGIHRLDLLVAGQLVVELKTVELLHRKHYAQVRSYMRTTSKLLGLLVNFSDYQLDARRVELHR